MQAYVFVAQAGDELGLPEDLHGALAVIKQVGDLLDGHLLARDLVVRAPVQANHTTQGIRMSSQHEQHDGAE